MSLGSADMRAADWTEQLSFSLTVELDGAGLPSC